MTPPRRLKLSRLTTRLTVCLVALAWLPAAANPVRTENVEAELVAETRSLAPGTTHWLQVVLRIRDGWHTYWRNPGDSGEATRLSWTLPAGVSAGDIVWPYPQAIPFAGFVNYGYEGAAYHLVPIEVGATVAPQDDLVLAVDAHWLVCDEICIPESARLELVMPVRAAAPTADPDAAPLFAAARERLPTRVLKARFGRAAERLTLEIPAEDRWQTLHFFPFEWGAVEPAAAQILAFRDGVATLTTRAGAAPAAAAGGGVLVGSDAAGRRFALNVEAAAPVVDAPVTDAPVTMNLLTALAFALLGGVILNLMPCVFPVLSMKALHLMRHSASVPRERRRHGVAYTLGVLIFFALIGGALIVLRQSGAALGWGFQLQSPPFVAGMALLMFAIGLNLAGHFDLSGRFAGAGSTLAASSGLRGSFFTGALAALVATPCTAPFMGAALGFALTQPPANALLVVLTLGLGLALPFLLLSVVPGLAAWLPRPGPWMEKLKQALAYPMFAAAVWLTWVLSIQSGPRGVLLLLSAALLLAFCVWLYKAATGQPIVRAGTAAVAVAGVLVLIGASGRDAGPARTALAHNEEAFSPARLDQLRAAGRPVFVNQTAAWCLTCLVNEKNVLSVADVQAALRERDVVVMTGDWTRQDPRITAFLAHYGRSGVPLYVFYPAGRDPVVLPPLLTETMVLRALDGSE